MILAALAFGLLDMPAASPYPDNPLCDETLGMAGNRTTPHRS
jgi:hypothetical protein